MNDSNRIYELERRLDDLTSQLSNTEHELTLKIDDAKADAERAADSLRSDLNSLEHKVDFP